MFNQAIYNFAHLKLNYYTLAPDGNPVNYFGDHFSPITLLYAPLYYMSGSYTLLIIQVVAVLLGGYGAYRLAQSQIESKYLPLVVVTQFFLIWGIYSALSFDFHNNVVGAMLVPWLVYFYTRERKVLTLVLFSLILITKENMAIWLVFIFLALMVRGGISSWRKYLRFEIPLILAACIYFSIVVGILMPALNSAPVSSQTLRYSNIGNSPSDIAVNLVTQPKHIVSSFFDSRSDGHVYIGKKTELHLMVLTQGGISFLLAPYYLIALIPLYLQKFLTNEQIFWGINLQYSIEFVPILSLAFIDFLSKINRRKQQYAIVAALAVTLLTYGSLVHALSAERIYAPDPANVKFFSTEHYQSQHDISDTYKALELIPGDAILSASSSLAPHLSFRDKIYLFPNVKDAEYIALLNDKVYYWPLDRNGFLKAVQEYSSAPDFEVVYNNNDLIIFKKKV